MHIIFFVVYISFHMFFNKNMYMIQNQMYIFKRSKSDKKYLTLCLIFINIVG